MTSSGSGEPVHRPGPRRRSRRRRPGHRAGARFAGVLPQPDAQRPRRLVGHGHRGRPDRRLRRRQRARPGCGSAIIAAVGQRGAARRLPLLRRQVDPAGAERACSASRSPRSSPTAPARPAATSCSASSPVSVTPARSWSRSGAPPGGRPALGVPRPEPRCRRGRADGAGRAPWYRGRPAAAAPMTWRPRSPRSIFLARARRAARAVQPTTRPAGSRSPASRWATR